MTSLAWVNKGISTRYIMQVHEGARSATGNLQCPFVEGEGDIVLELSVYLSVILPVHTQS